MNSEAILQKLIELGYTCIYQDHLYKDVHGSFCLVKNFLPLSYSHDFELIQRALFDECGKREFPLMIDNNVLKIIEKEHFNTIYEGDTSRQSFLQAFKKVVGIE